MSDAAGGNELWVAAPLGWREACFALPALRGLAGAGLRLTLLCPETQRWLWEAAALGEVESFSGKASPRTLAARLRGVERVLLWESGAPLKAAAKAGVPRRIGPAALGERLTDPIESTAPPGPLRHAVEGHLEIAAALGAGPPQPEHFEPLPVAAEPRPGQALLLPESDFGAHYEWPVARWVEVGRGLEERGWSCEVGGEGGRSAALAEALGRERLAVSPGRREPLLAAALVVAADGSLPHLAAALGRRCAVLFGPGEPALHRPLGREHLSIRHKVECSPCLASRCLLDGRCQDELDATRVLDALEPLSPSSGTRG